MFFNIEISEGQIRSIWHIEYAEVDSTKLLSGCLAGTKQRNFEEIKIIFDSYIFQGPILITIKSPGQLRLSNATMG